jgi:hypothetical protein
LTFSIVVGCGGAKKSEEASVVRTKSADKHSVVFGTDWNDGTDSDAAPSRVAKSETKKEAAPSTPPPAKSDVAVADAVTDAVAGTADRARKQAPKLPPAGVLTAGSFDDNLDPLVFASFAKRFEPSRWQDQLPVKLAGPRVQILVKDAAGRPVAGARVKLSTATKPGVEIPTRSLGQATFVLTWDGLPTDEPLMVHVLPPDGSSAGTDILPIGAPRWEVTLPSSTAKLPKNLDLALVLDTTGSMGDELKYILAEIKGISADIKAKFPEVNQRFGLVLYRDFGDEYLTRIFDFTPSLYDFHRNLAKQKAEGGGDYPEAVHEGLTTAQQLRWRLDSDTARIAFLIGDAPPHAQYMKATMQAVNILRKEGVAIYPIACSGYDDACELIWRSSALLTSSHFLFLTDDSGVGESHAEPKIPYYHVEHLNKLMVRMLACELTGERLPPAPGDVIRVVGRKVN